MANTKKPNQELGSPVGGVVFKLMATPGQAVAEGDTLAVISAMKMEVSVKAPKSGTIADVVVKKDEEKLKSIVWPASAVDMAEGGLGTPHHGFPKIMLDAILKGKPRL